MDAQDRLTADGKSRVTFVSSRTVLVPKVPAVTALPNGTTTGKRNRKLLTSLI
jgi:hypothetical protein